MFDLKFNISTRELEIENGDFAITDSISEQNGGIILNFKNSILENPILGLGLISSINLKAIDLNNLLSRWKQQVLGDGGVTASYTVSTNQGLATAKTEVNYG